VKEYDLYVPLNYNDGSPIEPRKLVRIRNALLNQFGGLTYFPQHNEGFWSSGGVTFRDEIVIYRVLADKVGTARRFLRRLKDELKRDLEQQEILIVEKDAEVL
jgi:hypothetical protein